jgi:hypothetical protein
MIPVGPSADVRHFFNTAAARTGDQRLGCLGVAAAQENVPTDTAESGQHPGISEPPDATRRLRGASYVSYWPRPPT